MKSLPRIIRASSGQDISRCQGCFDCDIDMPNERDIPLGSLIQLAILDDEEALLSRTLWSDSVLQASRGACKRGINLHAVMMVLREEAKKRNLCDDFEQDALPGTARRIVPDTRTALRALQCR